MAIGETRVLQSFFLFFFFFFFFFLVSWLPMLNPITNLPFDSEKFALSSCTLLLKS